MIYSHRTLEIGALNGKGLSIVNPLCSEWLPFPVKKREKL
jgi:hypothetical protein